MSMKLRIVQDDDPMSPREWDNVGTMLCFHKRHSLGDDNPIANDDFDSWEDIEQHLRAEYGAVAMLPLYLYDHGALSMNTAPFGCRWDSGRVGVIYTTEKQLTYIGVDKANANAALADEVNSYDQFLRSEIYAYVVKDRHGTVVESCGGFYSEDDARSDGEAAMRYAIEALGRPCAQRALYCE